MDGCFRDSMEERLEKCILELLPEAEETLVRWVRQPSVKGEAEDGAPFGKDVRAMLELCVSDCVRLGFDAKNVAGYAGLADLGEGDDRDALGILGHLDVVPVGEGWTMDPWTPRKVGDRIYGRGTSDDKGPMVAAMFAALAVKKAGIPLKRKVRFVFGCDEETGMESIDAFKRYETMPRSGFSPDADYPVINIEKGGCHVVLSGKLSGEGVQLVSFHTGHASNVIPGKAEAEVLGDETLAALAEETGRKLGFDTEARASDGRVHILTRGIQGHAAMGDQCKNAIGQMLLILKGIGVGGAVAALADTVGMTYHGENLGIAVEDALSGPLTCSLDIIDADEKTGEIRGLMDIRYPLLMSVDSMMNAMTMTLNGRLQAELVSARTPHFVSAETRLVKELLYSYEKVTGLKGEALAIGGGTYARAMEEGVAFGALFPGDEEMAHQPDEYIDMKRFLENMRIFAYAIARLCA